MAEAEAELFGDEKPVAPGDDMLLGDIELLNDSDELLRSDMVARFSNDGT